MHESEVFATAKADVSILPSTVNNKARTVDAVWYGGAQVDRVSKQTGEPYKLRLDMGGANLDRLNAGAPVFDNHMTGSDFVSAMANKLGTQAQVGVVLKAWADGKQGKATLKFAEGNPTADAIFKGIESGIINNLSFGTWINEMGADPENPNDPEDETAVQNFLATKWEPFEISPVCVPADFSTQFLSAGTQAELITNSVEGGAGQTTTALPNRATALKEKQVPETQLGAEAQTANTNVTEAANLAAQALARTEGAKAERERIQQIQLAAAPFAAQLGGEFITTLTNSDVSFDSARIQILEKLAVSAAVAPRTATPVTFNRDQADTRRANMEASLLYRGDPSGFKDMADKGREYMGYSLVDYGRECLNAVGVRTAGMPRSEIVFAALQGQFGAGHYFHGMGTTSDFPNILGNVANKNLRKAYEAWVQTFKPFSRMVTAPDFRPRASVQLSDLGAMPKVNEKGEFHHTVPAESAEKYSIATYGEIVNLTRQVIINDDLQAFTRVPAMLGTSAAQTESNAAWLVFTANANMADGNALFSTAHKNLISGAGSALSASALGAARAKMRTQTSPSGNVLNLVPKYLIVPAALEQAALQLINPLMLAASSVTAVVPQWIQGLQIIVEPRLDVNSTTAWYLVADPAQIDTIEYAYLEGQEGVYTETQQGFDIDGVRIKGRLDFAAAVVEFRGVQKNVGA